MTCCNCLSLNFLSEENAYLRQQNQLLARQLSLLRKQLDAKQLFFEAIQPQHLQLKSIDKYCGELNQKLERSYAQMQKKVSFYEQQINRYRQLVNRLISQAAQTIKPPQESVNSENTVANQQTCKYHVPTGGKSYFSEQSTSV